MSRTGSSISLLKALMLSFGICLLTSACGFHPVYGKTETNDVSNQLASVRIEKIPGREGQILQNKLSDLLNPASIASSPEYSLKVVVKDQHRELGINTDLRVTRYDVIPNVNYYLTSLSDNKLVDSGRIVIKSSYNRTTSEFATFVAEQNATQLANEEIAEEMRSRLIYYFSK